MRLCVTIMIILVFFGQGKRGKFLSLPWKLVKHVTSKHHLNWIYICRFWKWAAWHVELSTMLSVFLSRIIFQPKLFAVRWSLCRTSCGPGSSPALAEVSRRGGAGRGGVTPVLDYGELSPGSGTSLLLRPEDNSPFSSWARRDKSTSSDNLSNLYSQISGISTYEDYEGGWLHVRRVRVLCPDQQVQSLHRRSGIIKNGSSVADRNPGNAVVVGIVNVILICGEQGE